MPLLNLYRELWIRWRIWWHQLALSQIDPCHEDVPHIIRTLRSLSDQLDQLKGSA